MTTSMLFISLFFFLSLPSVLPLSDLEKLYLPSNTTGSEALAFDPAGAGPYTGVSAGRILKYVNPTDGFQDFAVTSPTRPKQLCDGSSDPARESICGRPLGLEFNKQTGLLYISDAYFGLVAVGPNGGTAAQLVTSAEGVPFRFFNGLEIEQETGITGRLLKYDPVSKVVTLLQRNLGLPVGVAVSKNGQFLVYTEALFARAQRFWLIGLKANTSEVFATFPGSPDNIKRSAKGEFWVPIYTGAASLGVRLSANGRLLQILKLSALNPVQHYSEVHEYQGKIYLGSVMAINYVGVID
ncbi:hypothetical protein Pint_16354 [Pistacia integerrima]|uniref:Uncharacterized protein n=1 Tax=Pistacia integerrima TaxID=434235 RepID=A0ACC0ZC05_9ROSI|nr:hypothetical protein Pint_16354 [Pistacia integerrima]